MRAFPPLLRRILVAADEAPDDADTIEEHLRLRTLVLSRAITLGVALCCLAWWPLDRFLPFEGDEVGQLVTFRIVGTVATLSFYAVLRFLPVARRHPSVVLLTACTVMGCCVSVLLGSVRAPERPLLYSLFVSCFASLAYVGPLGRRTAGTFSAAGVSVAALLVADPSAAGDPMFQNFAGVMAFACVCGIFAGHLAYLPTRESFFRGLALEHLNADLENRVAERTADLRRLSAHLSGVLESERTRLAREIHDELAQSLSTLRFEVELLGSAKPAGDDESLGRMHALLDATLATTRRILSGLRPRILDDMGVVAALDWLADDFRRRHPGVACTLAVEPPGLEVGPAHATALFRIVQECLSNVTKHAHARNVGISLARLDGALTLEVKDDGAGIPAGARRVDAMGLLGMRERTWQLSGTLEIDSGQGAGTTIRVRIPESAPQQEAA